MDVGSPAVDNGRTFRRFPLVLRVGRGGGVGATENLSRGGMFVQTDRPYSIGERIATTLSFPNLLESMDVSGVVTRRRDRTAPLTPDIPGLPAGVAVAFSSEVQERPVLLRLLDEAARASSADAPDASHLPSFRVLIVESDPALAGLYQCALAQEEPPSEGLIVDFARDGFEALRMLEVGAYDLVVTDLFMPAFSGYTLIERVRTHSQFFRVQIMVVSGGLPADLARAIRVGADAVASKPLRPRDLINTVRALLRVQEYSFAGLG